MPKFPKPMSDSQFIQVRLIRKKYAGEMGQLAHKMRKLAKEAKAIERRMQAEAELIAPNSGETIKLTSFVPHRPTQPTANIFIMPDFNDVECMANHIMHLADNALEDNTIVVSHEDKADYARFHLGILRDLPRDFNPATHYHYGDLCRIPDAQMRKEKDEYETPAGGWIVDVAEEDSVPETPQTP